MGEGNPNRRAEAPEPFTKPLTEQPPEPTGDHDPVDPQVSPPDPEQQLGEG